MASRTRYLLLIGLLVSIASCVPVQQSSTGKAGGKNSPITAATDTLKTDIGAYIVSQTIVRGSTKSQTQTTFTSSAGLMIPPNGISLDPQNPIRDSVVFRVGRQVLWVDELMLTPPLPSQPGYVSMIGSYTDIYGANRFQFAGTIAKWTL